MPIIHLKILFIFYSENGQASFSISYLHSSYAWSIVWRKDHTTLWIDPKGFVCCQTSK